MADQGIPTPPDPSAPSEFICVGHPLKRPGETFNEYWQRITNEQAIDITLESKWVGITPQGLFIHYIRHDDGGGQGAAAGPGKP